MKGLQYFDTGHTASFHGTNALERAMRFTNGTGDDLADAVRESLGLADSWALEDEMSEEFGDPLEILIRAEERGLL